MSEQRITPPASQGATFPKKSTPTRIMIPAILLIIVGAVNLIYGGQATIRNALRFNEPPALVNDGEDDEPPERNTQLARDLDKLMIQPLNDFNKAIGPYEREFNGQHIVRRESEKRFCFSYHDAAAIPADDAQKTFTPNAGGFGLGGGFGGAVHSGGFAK